jgi:hypothetical protein
MFIHPDYQPRLSAQVISPGYLPGYLPGYQPILSATEISPGHQPRLLAILYDYVFSPD